MLGYNRYNVFGLSYGTYLAQTLMRDHPEGIRSVILDLTVPIRTVTLPRFWDTLREGFDNLFEACEAQPRCREKAPHLKTTFTRLVREFEARPRTVVVANPQGKATKVVLDGGALIDWLRKKAGFDTPRLPQVPDQISELAAGRLESVAKDRAAATVVSEPLQGYGLAFGAICREWNPFGQDEPVAKRAFPAYPGLDPAPVGRFVCVCPSRLRSGLAGSVRLARDSPPTPCRHPDPAGFRHVRQRNLRPVVEAGGTRPAERDRDPDPGRWPRRHATLEMRSGGGRLVPRPPERAGHLLRAETDDAAVCMNLCQTIQWRETRACGDKL